MLDVLFQVRSRKFRSLSEPRDARQILSTCSSLRLLSSSVHEVRYPHALSHVKCAYALRSVYFVRRHRKEVDSQIFHVDRHIAQTLYSVRMEKHAVRLCNCRKLLDRFDSADLVVDHHYAHKDRVFSDSFFKRFRRYETVAVNVEISYFKSQLFEIFARVQYRMVLYPAGDYMSALVFQCVCSPFQDPVVRFCAARSEEDLLGLSIDKPCYPCSRFIESGLRIQAY